jgi:hypothetical protein
VFFDYPEGLGIGSRCDAGCVTEQLGQRSLTFKTHWERNSVKNAFSRVRKVQCTITVLSHEPAAAQLLR